jgi:hypothetical protein
MPGVLFWGMTFDFIGTIILAVAILRVHTKLEKEHKVDRKVIGAIEREKKFAYIAMVFIIIGYVLQIYGGNW